MAGPGKCPGRFFEHQTRKRTVSVKNPDWVMRYKASIDCIGRDLQSIETMLQELPAPEHDGHLPTLHYGHIGSVIEISNQLSDLAEAMRQVTTTR